jgi:methylmalonyl-CoA/ethylmalonyl-CoA epimerase
MQLFSRIDHVSIAVRDYEKARHFFETVFGVISGKGGPDDSWDFNWRVFSLGDLTRLELISDADFLANFLAKKEGGVHHITLETPDIRRAAEHLDRHQVPYFGYSEEMPEWKELFVHPKDAFGVLIQVAEFDPDAYLDESQRFVQPGPRWAVSPGAGGVDLTIAHPGGGKATIALSKDEAKQLAEELSNML